KPRQKKMPSVVNQLEPYNISEDILSMKANATYGQAKPPAESNQVSSVDVPKTTVAKCYVWIGNKMMIAILDMGAA
ncbi:17831_t:CDS:2, partial [Acaulospora morrowiae]